MALVIKLRDIRIKVEKDKTTILPPPKNNTKPPVQQAPWKTIKFPSWVYEPIITIYQNHAGSFDTGLYDEVMILSGIDPTLTYYDFLKDGDAVTPSNVVKDIQHVYQDLPNMVDEYISILNELYKYEQQFKAYKK